MKSLDTIIENYQDKDISKGKVFELIEDACMHALHNYYNTLGMGSNILYWAIMFLIAFNGII